MRFAFILIILYSLCSCKAIERKIFSPTQINNPSLQKKNDHSFAVAFSTPSGFDFTGGYAITNRLAIIGGAYTHKNRDNEQEILLFSNHDASAELSYRHKGFHGGMGVYFPLSKKKKVVSYGSFFGGYTYGSFRMDERYFEHSNNAPPPTPPVSPTRISFYKSNISRYFLQGSVSLYGKVYEFSLIARYNYVGYSTIITNYTAIEQVSFRLPPQGYPEFSQFLDLGFDSKFFLTKNRRFGLQVFWASTLRLNRKEYNPYYYDFRLGIGLVVKNPFKKK